MLTIIINTILIWVVLLISLKIIKLRDVTSNSRFYISVIGIAIVASILQSILLLLYVTIFGQFNPVNSFIADKIAIVGSLALFFASFLFLLFLNKLPVKQAFLIGITVGLFANYTNYILLFHLVLSVLGVRLFPF